jgi:glycosyltransferase involved in cell wall biosynthesis
MKVCLLSMEWPPYGCGIGSYMFNLARGLVSQGHEVTLITHDQDPVACAGVRVLAVPLPDSRRTIASRLRRNIRRVFWGIRHPWSWEAYQVFQETFEREPVDIVETAEFGAWGWHFLGEARVPIVVRCHNPAHIVWSVNQLPSRSWAMPAVLRKQDRLEREQAYGAQGIASPSYVLANHLSLSWAIPLNRFTVIPNPIDAELFCPDGAGTEKREILYVGRFEYNKGVYDLAQAVVPVLAAHRDICVRFVGMDRPAPAPFSCGSGTASDAIRRLVPKEFHDRLLFTCPVPVSEIADLQRKALLAVMPTRGFESFAYTVLEPMACGTAVIATRCGGPSEIVTHGVDGWLIPPGRPAALTEAMQYLLSNSAIRRSLGTHGRQTVERRFSTSVILPRITDWYSEMIRQFHEDRGARVGRECGSS